MKKVTEIQIRPEADPKMTLGDLFGLPINDVGEIIGILLAKQIFQDSGDNQDKRIRLFEEWHSSCLWTFGDSIEELMGVGK